MYYVYENVSTIYTLIYDFILDNDMELNIPHKDRI